MEHAIVIAITELIIRYLYDRDKRDAAVISKNRKDSHAILPFILILIMGSESSS